MWCSDDCWEDVKHLKSLTPHSEAVLSCVGARQLRIYPTAEPIPVNSAFGGLGIYKRRYLLGRRYFGLNRDGSPICEHVPLNESIASDGGKLFIFPRLLVSTPYEHIQRARDIVYYRTRVGEYLKGRRR
jgi:hypothetical protein